MLAHCEDDEHNIRCCIKTSALHFLYYYLHDYIYTRNNNFPFNVNNTYRSIFRYKLLLLYVEKLQKNCSVQYILFKTNTYITYRWF